MHGTEKAVLGQYSVLAKRFNKPGRERSVKTDCGVLNRGDRLGKLLKLIVAGSLVLMTGMVSPEIAAQEQGEEKVESVEVQLSTSGQLYEGLLERIEFSIGRVGDRILLAQPVALLKENRDTVRTAIYKVFSKVLMGFQVESVDVVLGKHTKILIHLIPIPPLITDIQINLNVRNVTPEIKLLTHEISEQMENEINKIFTGLPVAAVSWSENIFNLVANYLLEREFPGFKTQLALKAGTQTTLQIELTPRDPVVKEVQVEFGSTNVPSWLVRYKAQKYQDHFQIIKGLPVEFLLHHQPKMENYFSNLISDLPELQNLGMQVRLKINPGITAKVYVGVTSEYLQLKLEGRYFMSQSEYFGNFQAYLGYRTDGYELYSIYTVGYHPGGSFNLGVAFPVEKSFTAGFEYEFENKYRSLVLRYQFERGDYLNWKVGVGGSPNAAIIGIVLNNHANVELANYADLFGIQLMFHF